MNHGNHINKNDEKIRLKIDELNNILTECVSKKYICSDNKCVLFINKYDKIYNYIDHYINQLKSKILSHQDNEGTKNKNLVMVATKSVNILIETQDDFIRDYVYFTNDKPKNAARGCILINLENINFVRLFYGNDNADFIIDLMERKLIAICNDNSIYNRCKYKIRVYAKNYNQYGRKEYIILVTSRINLQEFESFCTGLSQIRYNIPKVWKPISFTNQDNVKKYGKLLIENEETMDDIYGISPSKGIEGNCKNNQEAKKSDNKTNKKGKRMSIVNSLSRLIKYKSVSKSNDECKNEIQNIVAYDNDDAASISIESEPNDENVNIINHSNNLNHNDGKKGYTKKCEQLKTVFTTACGIFNDGSNNNIEYFEKCEMLQKRLKKRLPRDCGKGPSQLSNLLDSNDTCLIQKC